MLEALGEVGEKRAIEALAESFRQRHPQSGPPVSVDVLAGKAGIMTVRYADDMDGSAMLVGSMAGMYGVVLNRKESRTRQRFSLAHEIAHRVLDPNRKAHLFEVQASRQGRSPVEKACDFFAACLLMPRDWVNDAIARGDTVAAIARLFDVSQPAARHRLDELGWRRQT